MLSPDKNIFLSIPEESVMLILHPAQVVACDHDVYTAVVEEDDVPLEPEQEIFLYFEISRTFMKQSARIKEVAPEDPKRLIRFTTIGNAVSSEKGKGKRYGFYCIDKQLSPGSLSRGLPLISLAVQREHLRGLERTG